MNSEEIILYLKDQIMLKYGMKKFAELMGCSRTSLYKTLHKNSNPEFNTIIKIIEILGIEIKIIKNES